VITWFYYARLHIDEKQDGQDTHADPRGKTSWPGTNTSARKYDKTAKTTNTMECQAEADDHARKYDKTAKMTNAMEHQSEADDHVKSMTRRPRKPAQRKRRATTHESTTNNQRGRAFRRGE
jgi:hypothetical protein